MTVATYDDVLAIERTPLAERNIPSDALRHAARRLGDRAGLARADVFR